VVYIPITSNEGTHALVFVGTYEHVIDAKQRLAIPAEMRSQIKRATEGDDDGSVLYVTLGEQSALCLYTARQFQVRAAQLDQSERDTDEILDYETLFYSTSRRVEIDKNGRVRLPEHLINMAGLGTEVVLLGVKDHIQIRDRQTWRNHVEQTLAANPKILVNPRRAMRRPGGERQP